MAKIKPVESQQSPQLHVLEIGCGEYSLLLAKNAGGLIFKNQDVKYVGIDLPETLAEPSFSSLKAAKKDSDVIAADCADMPFEDRSFDLVLMRSVFGQFTDPYTKFRIDNVRRRGLMESWRVLKPGGEIAIAEENTPWYPNYVEGYLQAFGFHVTAFAYMQENSWEEVDQANSEWIKLRAKYFGDAPIQQSKWNAFGAGYAPPYLMTAIKPEGAEEVTEPVVIGLDNGDDPLHPLNRDVYSDRTYTFGKPTQETRFTKHHLEAVYS